MARSSTSYQEGHSGNPAGRTKGMVKKRWIRRVEDVLEERGICPINLLLDELETIDKQRDRVFILLELLSYCRAKPKVEEKEPELGKYDGIPLDELIIRANMAKPELMDKAKLRILEGGKINENS